MSRSVQRSILMGAALCGLASASRADVGQDYADLKICALVATTLSTQKGDRYDQAGDTLVVKLYAAGEQLGKSRDQVMEDTLFPILSKQRKSYKDDPDALVRDKAYCEGKGYF